MWVMCLAKRVVFRLREALATSEWPRLLYQLMYLASQIANVKVTIQTVAMHGFTHGSAGARTGRKPENVPRTETHGQWAVLR